MATRKYFLDWLRVGAFALLILFHVSLLYVTWPYNLKSPWLVPELEQVVQLFSVWRMPLIFLIAGVASRFLLGKLGAGGFALDRVRRLLPVILFGMFVVIPPQTYVELVAKGVTHQSYLRFWLFSYLAADQTLVAPLHKTMPTWDHLWFLVYLLDYALVFAFGAWLFRRAPRAEPMRLPIWLVFAPGLWLAACNVLIDTAAPLTHDLVHDWGGHLKWIGMFATGVVCATRAGFWDGLRDARRTLALTAVALFGLQLLSHRLVWSAVSGLYAWAAICAVCGYAHRYLDRPSKVLTYLNEAVLPIYVLHQPILLVTAFWLLPLRLPLTLESALLVAATGLGSLAVYEAAIRPFGPARRLFGLKAAPKAVPQAQPAE